MGDPTIDHDLTEKVRAIERRLDVVEEKADHPLIQVTQPAAFPTKRVLALLNELASGSNGECPRCGCARDFRQPCCSHHDLCELAACIELLEKS